MNENEYKLSTLINDYDSDGKRSNQLVTHVPGYKDLYEIFF